LLSVSVRKFTMRQAIYSLIDFIQEARNAELEIANQ
jgi:hypothetical protein